MQLFWLKFCALVLKFCQSLKDTSLPQLWWTSPGKDYIISPGKDKSWKGQILERTCPGKDKRCNMSGKGGARHEVKPWVDVGILFKCLENHKDLVTDMGSYEHMNSQSARNAKALLDLKALWGGLLELSPCGSIHSQPLRQALISLLSKEPDVNSGKHSGGVWANLKIERINCMLKHVRQRGRNRNSLGLAASQLTRLEYQSLLAGLEKLEVSTQRKMNRRMQKQKKRRSQKKGLERPTEN